MSPRTAAAALAVVAGASCVGVRAQARLQVMWQWSGALSTTTAIVKAKVLEPGKDLHLRYSLDRDLNGSRRTPLDTAAVPDADGIVTFAPADLTAHSQYYYAVTSGDDRATIGQFRTFADGPMSFEIGFASCAGGNMFSTVSNSVVFTTIENRHPLFFLHMGDLHYMNISRNDVRLFQRAYDIVLVQRRQASMYQHVPIVYMWDDHDFGPNDSDRTSPARPAARKAYAQVVPHYPLVLENGQVTTIQQEFTVGRVRFIITDQRSDRDPIPAPDGPNKTTLGLKQRAWLADAFARASRDDVPLVVWVSTFPWITHQGSRDDGWEPYSWERRWIADRIAALGLTHRLVMLSGDAHMLAMDDGTHSNYASDANPGTRGFVVVQAAPLDRSNTIKGGPYTLPPSVRNGQFGWLEVRDDGQELRATLTGHDQNGGRIPGMQLKLTCRASACQVGG